MIHGCCDATVDEGGNSIISARPAYLARATTSAGYAAPAGTRCAAGRRFSRSLTALMTRE